jgi:hypothetical protein
MRFVEDFNMKSLRKRISQHSRRFLEADEMLAEIRGRFISIPFKAFMRHSSLVFYDLPSYYRIR